MLQKGISCNLAKSLWKYSRLLSGSSSLPIGNGYCSSSQKRPFKSITIKDKAVSKWKSLEENKMLRFILQMRILALRSLVRTWDTFSEVILALNLAFCGEVKDLLNQNLLTTSSKCVFSWDTQIKFSSILLVIHILLHCVAFPLFQS